MKSLVDYEFYECGRWLNQYAPVMAMDTLSSNGGGAGNELEYFLEHTFSLFFHFILSVTELQY